MAASSATISSGRKITPSVHGYPGSNSSSSSSSTRSICFVQRIEYQFSGSSVWPFALALGDLDNDAHGDYELAVGNVHGDLFIYKHICEQPWKKASNLGSIVCIGIGDVLNEGKNFLVTLSCEGWCHIFDVPSEASESGSVILPTNSPSATSLPCVPSSDLQALYKQNDIGVNVKLLLLDDIDGDGKIELVVGHTDKFVKAYRWEPNSLSADQFASDLGSGCLLIDSGSLKDEAIYDPTTCQTTSTEEKKQDAGKLGSPKGKFVPVYGWRLEHIIGTISVIFWNGQRHLAVAQRGNNYALLFVDRQGECDPSKYEGQVHYQQITGGRARNTEANCGILGNIRTGEEKDASIFATVTQNGNIYLQKFMNDEHYRILSLTVKDYHLFPYIYKFDVTGEGREEIVVCARNGMTYIIDHSKNVVKFPFQQDVLAFVAGDFSIRPNCKAPCLVYVTFNNKIMLYYDIKLPRLDSTSLIETMMKDQEVISALEKLGIKDNPLEQKKLYRKLLYDS